MDKCREQFEEWAALEGLPLLFLDKHNFYESHVTDIAWQAWQASRQALVVELPAPCYRAEYTDHCDNSLEWDNYYEIDEVKSALDKAGASYK